MKNPLRLHGRGRALVSLGARTVLNRLGAAATGEPGSGWVPLGQDWFRTLSELRGAAMKLGQMASQYADLLPPAFAEALSLLQSQAEPVDIGQIETWLAQRWTPQQREQLATLHPVPIGVASIGQVHRATLVDGREVAVKVQYPGVADAIDRDVRNLGRLLRLAKILPVENARLDALLEEVRLRLHEECDYADEAARMTRFRAGAAGMPIVIPRVVDALSTADILVTDYTPAAALDEVRRWPAATRNRIGVHLLDWIIHQLAVLKEVHADPHPGNFGFRESGEIVVYDFGCTRHLADIHLQHFQRMTHFGLTRDYAAMHAELGRVGSLTEPDRPMSRGLDALYRDITGICMEAVEAEPYDFADGRIIDDLRARARESLGLWTAFQPLPELAFVARMLSGSYWLLRGLKSQVALAAPIADFAAAD
ncbi:MAG: AarF/ABC1/UbiB kinase family protein [Oceanococcaceae bacterium]